MKDRDIWERIAESFDKTRRKPWKKCIEFISSLPRNSTVVDIGCGNGRHLLVCAEKCSRVIGIDFSKNLLRIVRKKIREKDLRNAEVILGDCRNLPIKDNSIDHALFVATLHNIKGRKIRIDALKEMKRILKDGGTALVTVWARWQDRFFFHFIKSFFIRKGEFGDIEVLWKANGLNLPRFYHLYSKREFVRELKAAGLEIEKVESVKIASRILKDNFFAIVKK